jgi:hypothetical protein
MSGSTNPRERGSNSSTHLQVFARPEVITDRLGRWMTALASGGKLGNVGRGVLSTDPAVSPPNTRASWSSATVSWVRC